MQEDKIGHWRRMFACNVLIEKLNMHRVHLVVIHD